MVLYVGHHRWPTKNILALRCSKMVKITLETISFWQNISVSIFKFSPLFYTMKACQWNLIKFSKFTNALISKEKKRLMEQSMRKEKRRNIEVCFITVCFIESFNMIIKVHESRFENLSKCLCSYKNNPLKFNILILRILQLLSVKFVNFFKSRLFFNILYCF